MLPPLPPFEPHSPDSYVTSGQSTVLSPLRFRNALSHMESIEKVPRPHPFKGGAGTRHDLYRDSPPAPSVPPMVPVVHPDLLPPAATDNAPLRAAVAATGEAIVLPVDATPEATPPSQAAESAAATTPGSTVTLFMRLEL